MFALVSQSLVTGEPMHQTLPQTLLDRLFYHRNASPLIDKSQKDMHEIDEISSMNFMFYAAGLGELSSLCRMYLLCMLILATSWSSQCFEGKLNYLHVMRRTDILTGFG